MKKYFQEVDVNLLPCREACDKVDLQKQNAFGFHHGDRIIKRFFYQTGKIKIDDFPVNDEKNLKEILSTSPDEV